MWLTRLAVAAGIWSVLGATAQVNAQSFDSGPKRDGDFRVDRWGGWISPGTPCAGSSTTAGLSRRETSRFGSPVSTRLAP